ncbi:hypothetical protein [Burkholderia vietnamiensis]|uniref:hypothetical protein n=1 Tax=Burkholderia vietnamiensis TaxID=60552 RepID=UPI001593F390|nr:hypothetical protein [Burkholderia vietnamiensis]
MLDASQFDLGDVVEAYVFANTSSFLGKRLRESVLVQRLGLLYEPELLASTIGQIAAKPVVERRIEDVALAYACFGSLYLRDRTQAKALLGQFELTSLKWAAELAAYFEPMIPSTTDTVIFARVEPRIESPHLILANSSTDLSFRLQSSPVLTDSSLKPATTNSTYFKFKTTP